MLKYILIFLMIAVTYDLKASEQVDEPDDIPDYIPHTLPNYNRAGSFSAHLNTFFFSEPNTISVPAALRLSYSPVNNFSIGLMAVHYKFKQTISTENGTRFYDDVVYRHFFYGINGQLFITDFLHTHLGLKIHPDYFNIYLNGFTGYGTANAISGGDPDTDFVKRGSKFGYGMSLGFRSLFTDTIGFFAEAGYSDYGYLKAGVSFLIIK